MENAEIQIQMRHFEWFSNNVYARGISIFLQEYSQPKDRSSHYVESPIFVPKVDFG